MKKHRKNKPAPPPNLPPETDQIVEEQPKKQPFLKRLLFGEETPDLSELEAGSTTILDILSPTSVDTKSRDYIVVDGIFHAYLYITGYGYSTTVGASWLAPLVEAGEGVSISFHFDKQSKEKILAKISQQTMMNRSRMRDVADTRQDFEELDSAIASGMYLKDVMNRQGEDFYYMHTLIEVTAGDPETLEHRVTAVEKLCVSVDMISRRCEYKQEQAFLSMLPILYLDPDIERKSRRNALTSGVAAAFPFASYELSDRNGIFLGLNMYNRSPVFLNPYDDYKYTNGNIWIGGSSGAGKTFTLQCVGGRLRQQGKRVIYIIPKKVTNFVRAVSSLADCICGCRRPRRTARILWPSAENHWTPTRDSKVLPPVTIPCWRIKSHGLSSGTACKSATSAMKTETIWTHRWSSATGAMASRLTMPLF